MEQFVEGNENKKKRIRRDGRARKKTIIKSTRRRNTYTHLWFDEERHGRIDCRIIDIKDEEPRTLYRDNNRVDDSNIMRPRNGRRIEHVNSSGQKQMQSESHWNTKRS